MNSINFLKNFIIFAALIIIFCPRARAGDGLLNSESEGWRLASSAGEEFEDAEDGFEEEGFSEEGLEEKAPKEKTEKSDFEKELEKWFSASRFTLRHEYSYRTRDPARVVNNRSSFRFELSRFLGEYFLLRIDSKADLFYRDDHRIRNDQEKEYMIETEAREAYLQASFGDTSLKLGYQVLVWGEADGRAITDVVSPRDVSEFFFIPLEESRVGQLMLVVDQYGVFGGELTLFYVPKAEFDKQPDSEGEYHIDFFPEFPIKTEEYGDDDNLEEYGVRWKISSGKSDVAIMAANLIENTCAYEDFKFGDDLKLKLKRTNQRYFMTGVAFNYAVGSYLWKGEIARKSKKTFNDLHLEVLEKDVVDAALGVEYSVGDDYRLSVDIFNSRILDWEEDILVYEESETNMLVNWSKKFLNDELSIDISTVIGFNGNDGIYILESGYDYDDQIKLEMNVLIMDINKEKSLFWPYRGQNRVTARFSYLF